VRVERVEQTGYGFTIEFEERWEAEGRRWYCREMIRADVLGGSIVELSIYCTGDWDGALGTRRTRRAPVAGHPARRCRRPRP
jgi:hypothetical protein